MMRATIAVIATTMIGVAHAANEPLSFSCSGTMIEPTALTASPKSVRLVLSPPQKIEIDLGQGFSKAQAMSDNRIQLKFRTKEFTGEFFHYTYDLFFIYKSGHLARFTCQPSP
jgi:hypothetical protein